MFDQLAIDDRCQKRVGWSHGPFLNVRQRPATSGLEICELSELVRLGNSKPTGDNK